jgi:hypothetical protein
MYFSTVVAFAALPFLVGAVPVSLNSPRTDRPMSVPLTKRSNHLNDDGSVNLEKLQAGIDHTMAFVFPLLFLCEGWILIGVSI